MAAEAFCIAVSMGSALGGMLGDFAIKEVGDQENNLRIAWLLRISGPHPMPLRLLGEKLASRTVPNHPVF